MTLEEKVERAIAMLAAAMQKSGVRRASGFVPNSPAAQPKAQLDELVAKSKDEPPKQEKSAA